MIRWECLHDARWTTVRLAFMNVSLFSLLLVCTSTVSDMDGLQYWITGWTGWTELHSWWNEAGVTFGCRECVTVVTVPQCWRVCGWCSAMELQLRYCKRSSSGCACTVSIVFKCCSKPPRRQPINGAMITRILSCLAMEIQMLHQLKRSLVSRQHVAI